MPETSLAFLLLFAMASVAALCLKPIYGLYLYVAVFYLHPPSRWWGNMLPDLRWALIAAVVTLVALFIHNRSLTRKEAWYGAPAISLFILYTAWMWMQLPWVPSEYHFEGVVLFTKYVLLCFLMYSLLDSENDFRGFCLAHVVGCAYFGLLVYLAPDSGRLEGVGGPGVNDANTLGMHLGTGLVFASFLLLASKGWVRWAVLCFIPFILNGIIQTESRGALVGLFLGGLFTVYLKPRRIRKTYYFFAVLGVVGFIFLANEAFLARMSTLGAAIEDEPAWDSSAYSRLEIASAQVRMFRDYPLGAGHQGTAWLSPSYIDDQWLVGSTGRRASHNTVMSVLVDQGLPGILLFSLIAWTCLKLLVRLKWMDKEGLPLEFGLYRTMIGGALGTVIGAGMFAQYLKAEVLVWCIVLLVVLWRLCLQEQERIQEEQSRAQSAPASTRAPALVKRQ